MTDETDRNREDRPKAPPEDAPTVSDATKPVVTPDEPTAFPSDTVDAASSVPEISPDYTGPRDDAGRPLPKSIGGYQISRVLGTGGMSIVYAALQKQPRRPVALKVMRSEVSAERAIRRFMREVEILGKLNHRCIAQVYDAGTHDDGTGARPFFVMEYIPSARTLIQYANEKEFSIKERLKLFVMVCAAIEHGHRAKIVHRDLKPSNILIDPSGTPKVIDFGVARAMELDVSPHTMQTEAGRLVGTIQYMSPEQVNAQLSDIDARSDVYALGVLLYKLLTGKHPYNLEGLPVYTAVQMICDVVPPAPSELRGELAGDLETVMLKSLDKSRLRRYKSAGSLGRDIVRYLGHKPINARRASAGYRAKLLFMRHRPVFVTSAAAIVIAGAAIAMTVMTMRNRGDESRQPVDRGTAPPDVTPAPPPADGRTSFVLREHTAGITALRFSPDGRRLATGSRDHTAMLWDLELREPSFVSDNHDAPTAHLAFTTDGTRLITAASDRSIVVLDPESGALIEKIYHDCADTRGLAIDAAATRAAFGCADLTLRILTLASDAETVVRGTTGAFECVSFSADGAQVIAGSAGGTIMVCDAATGAVLRRADDLSGAIVAVRFIGDDGEFIAVDRDGNAAIWTADEALPPRRFAMCTGQLGGLAFDAAGRTLACSTRRRVRLRDLRTDVITDIPLEENLFISVLAVSPDLDWIAVGDTGGRVHLLPVPGS